MSTTKRIPCWRDVYQEMLYTKEQRAVNKYASIFAPLNPNRAIEVVEEQVIWDCIAILKFLESRGLKSDVVSSKEESEVSDSVYSEDDVPLLEEESTCSVVGCVITVIIEIFRCVR